jgi:hypothetical protein
MFMIRKKHNILETYSSDCETLERPLHMIQKPLRLVYIVTLAWDKKIRTQQKKVRNNQCR